MTYAIKSSALILEQIEEISDDAKADLKNKMRIVEIDPFHFKRIHGCGILFRIRFEDQRSQKRLIYTVEGNNIILLFILDRKNEYKDIKRFLKRMVC